MTTLNKSQQSVEQFVSSIIGDGGISSSNQYHVEFSDPLASGGVRALAGHLDLFYGVSMKSGQGSNSVSKIVMLANEVQIPGVSMTAQDVKGVYKGINMKPAMAKVYNEMDMSFILDVNSMPFRMFKGWQDFIVGDQLADMRDGSAGAQTHVQQWYDDYIMNVKITKLEKHWPGQKMAEDNKSEGHWAPWSITLHKAYPYMVSSIPYSSGSSQVVKLSVGLYYERSYFTDPDKEGSKSGRRINTSTN